MKTKFNSNNKLPLKKMVEIPSIVVSAIFYENYKYKNEK